VAEEVNCDGNATTTEILECLQAKPASEIAVIRPSVQNNHYIPSIDTHSPSVFLPDTPYNILKDKKANPVPYIIGVVTAEWVGQALGILHSPEQCDQLNENWSDYAEDLLALTDVTKEELDGIKEYYFGDNPIGNETIVNLTNLLSDRTLNHCSYLSAIMHSEMADAYLYYLSKPPAKSYAEKSDPNFNASAIGFLAHADELQVLLRILS